jgi:hypothetical protein
MASRTEPLITYGAPDWKVNTGNLRERVAAAQARLREQRDNPAPVETPVTKYDAARIVYDLGLTNCAASRAFVNRILALEEEVRTTTQMFIDACTEISSLTARIEKLESRLNDEVQPYIAKLMVDAAKRPRS